MSNQPLNPNGVGAFLNATEIRLIRAVNGWLVSAKGGSSFVDLDKPIFVFESTASLAKHLLAMVGESKWTLLEQPRNEKGKFAAKNPEN